MATQVRESLRFPPGPEQNLLFRRRTEPRGGLLSFLTELSRDYGPVAGFRAAWLRCVAVNDAELIEHILVRDIASYRKSWDHRQLSLILGRGLLTSEGDFWRHQRRLAQPAFDHKHVTRYVPTILDKTSLRIAGWPAEAVVDIHGEMMALALDIVAAALFSSVLPHEAAVVSRALDVLTDFFDRTMNAGLPLPLWVPRPSLPRAMWHIHRLNRIIHRFIHEHRDADAPPDDLLTMLLAARDDQGRPMSDRQLRDELMTVFLAGHETTAIGLSWCLHLLSTAQPVLERIRDEVSAVDFRAMDAGDLSRLEFTRAVVQESLRLYPPAWGLGREAVRDTELGGYRIPKGTQVFFTQYVVHRDPRYYDEPEEFRPERWLDDLERRNPRFAYFPFGGGPRVCIGMHFSMIEMIAAVALIVRDFDLSPVEGQRIAVQPSVTLRPAHGIRLHVRRRA